MNKISALLALCLAALALQAQNASILVSPEWLNEHLNDPQVVVLQAGSLQMDYDEEHIPGARFLWYDWLAPDSPAGNMNAPDLKAVSKKLGELGVSNDSHVIVYYAFTDISPAARMFLTLEYLGMKGKVSFLNGGLTAWKAAGFPVTNQLPEVKRGKFKPSVDPILVDRFYVKERLNSQNSVIVDARFKRYYDGETTGLPRDGHLPGAVNIPYNEMVDQQSVFKPIDQLKSYFSPVIPADKEVITYCFIGQTASVVYLAGRILGYNMKLYDGSMQEWTRVKDFPIVKTTGQE